MQKRYHKGAVLVHSDDFRFLCFNQPVLFPGDHSRSHRGLQGLLQHGFLQAACFSCGPTIAVKALKGLSELQVHCHLSIKFAKITNNEFVPVIRLLVTLPIH